MNRLRRWFSPGTFIAIVALVVAVGGNALAARPESPSPKYTSLHLVNGWTGGPFSTAQPAVTKISGIVHFRGAIASGTSSVAFTLPKNFWPAKNVYVAVDMCNATNGRLHIQPSGVVDVEAEAGKFSNAQCFTSLAGVSFGA